MANLLKKISGIANNEPKQSSPLELSLSPSHHYRQVLPPHGILTKLHFMFLILSELSNLTMSGPPKRS